MRNLRFITVALVIASLFTGCVSAWMTQSTGLTPKLELGTHRDAVIAQLGQPKERRTDVPPGVRKKLSYRKKEISYFEVYVYRGKVNTRDEGWAQATTSAVTLGVGEVALVPLTAVDIATRKLDKNRFFVFFDRDDRIIDFLLNAKL